VLTFVSAVSAAILSEFGSARRQTDVHRNRLQAEWLLRSGYELAVAGLMDAPKDYAGETAGVISGGEVKIVVKKDATKNDVYAVEIEARYPAGPGAVLKKERRSLKRVEDRRGVRIETMLSGP
jgi:hypothetical protein